MDDDQSNEHRAAGMPAPSITYEHVAKLIDHSLVRPELTQDEVIEGCEIAREYGVASVSVRPCDIETAVRTLSGSQVKVGSVAGFPHGYGATAVKLYEVRDDLRRGAREIDAVINISKLVSRQFQHIETELLQMAEACHKEGALLKVIFENAYLTKELKIIACRICVRAGVDFAATSTDFASGGYTLEDVRLMRAHLPPAIGIKAVGGVRTIETLTEAHEAGCSRIGATVTASILDEWRKRLKAQETSAAGPIS